MKKDYNSIIQYIWKCYEKQNFNEKEFMFYKTRKEKGQHRAGIYMTDNQKYFFKIMRKDEYNNEELISKKTSPDFRIVPKYDQMIFDDCVIVLYEYVDTTHINSFNFLRSKAVSMEEKKQALNLFFHNKYLLLEKTMYTDKVTNHQKADRWFWNRIKPGERVDKFYGTNGERLINDMKNVFPDGVEQMKSFLNNIYLYLQQEHFTVFSYSHGDFHDFNFSLNGLFWDVDTFDYNPILNDFAVFYWHFYAREDSLIYKYSPWLTLYMYNQLKVEELEQIRELKKETILEWYDHIYRAFEQYNLLDELNNEFIFKLFCRMFLIDNVTTYDTEDKLNVYKFFDYVLQNREKNLKEILFSNPVTFPFRDNLDSKTL